MQWAWYLVLVFSGLVIGGILGHSKRPTEYVDDKTSDEVREALYRAGLVKSEVVDCMVELKKSRIVFFKQAE